MSSKKKLKNLIKVLLAEMDSDVFTEKESEKKRLKKYAKFVASNPTDDRIFDFFKSDVLKSSMVISWDGAKNITYVLTDSEIRGRSQSWFNYTLGSLIRRGVVTSLTSYNK